MAVIQKVRRILADAFPPPAKITLNKGNGIYGVIVSKRFRYKDSSARRSLIRQALERDGMSKDELKQITLIVGMTPDEKAARDEMDQLG